MIARKALLIVVMQGVGALLGYVALFFIAKYMDVSAFGTVSFAVSFAALFGVVSKLGFDQAHVKRVSEGRDLGECIGTFFAIKLALTVVYIITVFIALYAWTNVLGRGFESHETLIAIYIMVFYNIIAIPPQVFHITFQARKEIAKHQTGFFFNTLVRTIATILVALAGKGAIELAFTYIVGEIAMIIVEGVLFAKYPIKSPSRTLFRDYRSFAYPLVFVTMIYLLIANTDMVLIQLFWSSREVGYYTGAYKITQFLLVLGSAVGTLLMPTYSALHAKDNMQKIRETALKAERYLALFTFPLVAFVIALPKPIIHILLADKYYPAIPILTILPLWPLFAVLTGPSSTLFPGSGKPEYVLKGTVLMLSINLILDIILIPTDIKSIGLKTLGYGAVGAAIGSVCARFGGLLYYRFMAWRLFGMPGYKRILLYPLSAAIMGCIIYLANSVFTIGRWYHLLGFFFIGIGIYILILYLAGELNKEDYEMVIDTLNPIKMLKYIVEEIRPKRKS